MHKLKQAVEILSKNDKFRDVSVIGELNWRSIPESYIVEEVYIDSEHRIDVHRQDSTVIVNIHNLGLFQLI